MYYEKRGWEPGPDATDAERTKHAAKVNAHAKKSSVFMLVLLLAIAAGVGAVTATIGFWVIVAGIIAYYSKSGD